MLLTPEEAKKQACPFMIGPFMLAGIALIDRPNCIEEIARLKTTSFCDGPACKMGWRWVEAGCTNDECFPSETKVCDKCEEVKTKGYCGFASNPKCSCG